MTCDNQIALCKLHGCQTCAYKGQEENCPFKTTTTADACPTFSEMFNVYCSSEACRRRKDAIVASVRSDIRRLGLTEDNRSSEMTREHFKRLIVDLLEPLADGTRRRGATVQTHLDYFKALTSDYLEDAYMSIGRDLPVFSIPRFRVKPTPVQEVSDRTIRKVEVNMERWLSTGRESDRSAFIFCFFALYCGMRAGDICSLRWDVFKHTPVGIMIVYKPHKTLRSSDNDVSFLLDNRTWCKIEPLVGKPEDYVIRRHENRCGRKARKDGYYAGFHGYLRKKVNAMLAGCGIGNDFKGQKKAHALRKYFETDRALKLGCAEAAKSCGHSERVQRRFYLGSHIGKVC